jgi:hypothetical protein
VFTPVKKLEDRLFPVVGIFLKAPRYQLGIVIETGFSEDGLQEIRSDGRLAHPRDPREPSTAEVLFLTSKTSRRISPFNLVTWKEKLSKSQA